MNATLIKDETKNEDAEEEHGNEHYHGHWTESLWRELHNIAKDEASLIHALSLSPNKFRKLNHLSLSSNENTEESSMHERTRGRNTNQRGINNVLDQRKSSQRTDPTLLDSKNDLDLPIDSDYSIASFYTDNNNHKTNCNSDKGIPHYRCNTPLSSITRTQMNTFKEDQSLHQCDCAVEEEQQEEGGSRTLPAVLPQDSHYEESRTQKLNGTASKENKNKNKNKLRKSKLKNTTPPRYCLSTKASAGHKIASRRCNQNSKEKQNSKTSDGIVKRKTPESQKSAYLHTLHEDDKFPEFHQKCSTTKTITKSISTSPLSLQEHNERNDLYRTASSEEDVQMNPTSDLDLGTNEAKGCPKYTGPPPNAVLAAANATRSGLLATTEVEAKEYRNAVIEVDTSKNAFVEITATTCQHAPQSNSYNHGERKVFHGNDTNNNPCRNTNVEPFLDVDSIFNKNSCCPSLIKPHDSLSSRFDLPLSISYGLHTDTTTETKTTLSRRDHVSYGYDDSFCTASTTCSRRRNGCNNNDHCVMMVDGNSNFQEDGTGSTVSVLSEPRSRSTCIDINGKDMNIHQSEKSVIRGHITMDNTGSVSGGEGRQSADYRRSRTVREIEDINMNNRMLHQKAPCSIKSLSLHTTSGSSSDNTELNNSMTKHQRHADCIGELTKEFEETKSVLNDSDSLLPSV